MHNNLPLFYIGDIIPDPYRVGDFPIRGEKTLEKGMAEILKSIQRPGVPISTVAGLDKQVWFNNSLGSGQTFRLEVVGYGQEHLAVEVSDNFLNVSGKRGQKSFNQQYQIPSPEKLDFNSISVKVEHGLLEIVFPAKKTEIKTIKVL